MSEQLIRNMELHELKDFFKRIKKDFPKGEYPPYRALYSQMEKCIQKGVVYNDGNKDAAYAVYSEGKKTHSILISLLAVYEGNRGKGIGTAFLKKLIAFHRDKKSIIVEVEKPECAKSAEEEAYRIKRIDFYKNAGFKMITGIEYIIWDIPMHIMVMPQNETFMEIQGKIHHVMRDIYLGILGEGYIHKMEISNFIQ